MNTEANPQKILDELRVWIKEHKSYIIHLYLTYDGAAITLLDSPNMSEKIDAAIRIMDRVTKPKFNPPSQ